jgi:hypothetical protein
MPKSKHRKNHKKKVAAYKKRKQDQRNSMLKRFREQFQQQFAEEVQSEVNKMNEEKSEENNG